VSTCAQCKAPLAPGARFCAGCGAMASMAVEGAEDPMIGRVVRDRFRIKSILGEGGMGKVYLAEQRMGNTTRDVAIKVLQPELASDPQVMARFHRETETVVTLSHPNTISFYDFGEFEGTLFIAMEFIRGKSVAKVLQESGPIDPVRVERILLQVCGSLHEAHEAGIVHRDLKPDNVILTERAGQKDFVKVLDFGIAKRSEAEDKEHAKLTKQGMVLGTPPYMSPEQFTGQALDRRSDVYSLGVMAYEMLTAHLPFDAATPWEWATKHLTAQPTPIEKYDLQHKLQSRHRSAIEKSLHKDRDQRPATALAFAAEFAGVEDATGTWAMVSSAPTTGPRPATGRIPQTQLTPAAMPAVASRPPASMAPTPQAMPAAKSGGGKGLMIAIVLVVLLGGGAVGAYMAFSGPEVAVGGSGGAFGTTMPVLPVTSAPATAFPVTGEPATAGGTAEPGTAGPDTSTPGTGAPETTAPATAAEPGTSHTTKVTKHHETPRPETSAPQPETSGSSGPSEADIARARQLAEEGMNLVRARNVDGAIEALRGAQRLVGREHTVVSALKTAVSRRGAQQAQSLIQQGSCSDAQALYRRLRSVGAAEAAREFFGSHCPVH
jgi:serine/threonine-protein kinase